MGLRERAAADLLRILEDEDSGFGWPFTLTDPDGNSAELVGHSNDIGTTIDPDTGIPVLGRQASIAVALASLTAAGLGIPRPIASSSERPWVVTFDDIQGTAHTFKVATTAPDLGAGIVTCLLEAYVP